MLKKGNYKKKKDSNTLSIKLFLTRNPSNIVSKENIVKACNEVAAVYILDGDDRICPNDVFIHSKNNTPTIINTINDNLDPKVYPLMFPYGDKGWSINLKSNNKNHIKQVSMLQFYSHKIQYRGNFNPCLNMKKLSQQYDIDAFTKIENIRLNYIRQNQGPFRTE